eukprot:TRINITY_DN5228_c0_g2_i1.p1 TRINITY_DN5228_c0_g2~~TRINITY_DN5228_c0_g2_i1.p1  ORF type:complete len:228 (+),score=59.65 TRINITY_DN5228_c0_g2_i1:224-907(+)
MSSCEELLFGLETFSSIILTTHQINRHPSSFKGDVGVVSDCQGAIDKTIQKFGKVDVLVANAGIFPSKNIEDVIEKDFDEIFNVNVKGTFFIMKAALPHMKQKAYGRIVLTSSITGPVTGYPGWSLYGATKAAQLGLMRSASLEVAKYGITINAVLPGNIATVNTPEAVQYFQKMERSIPVGSIGQPEDIAHATLYLASPEARFVTGQTLIVDGGQVVPEESTYLTQ